MKIDGDIVSMLQKHAAKKRASSTPVVEEEEIIIEKIVDPSVEPAEDVTAAVEPTPVPAVTDVLPPTPPQPPSGYDVDRLPHDPGERLPIASYHANDQDAVRRAYILRGSFQPCFAINMVSEFLIWRLIMCLMEDQEGLS